MPTIYDHIDSNRKKTIWLVLLFPLVLSALIYVTLLLLAPVIFGEEAARGGVNVYQQANIIAAYILPIVSVAAILWVVISVFSGDRIMLSSAGAVEIDRRSQPEIYNIVENLCITAGLPVPKIYIIDDNGLNAFATGRNPQNASIAFTKGLVKTLDRQELEGVAAHELAHIGNRDVRLMLIIVAGISFFALLGQILFRAGARSRKQAAALLLAAGVVCMVYGYFLAPMIRLAVSRRREYQADASAALLTRNPAGLANALRKISGTSKVESLKKMEAMAAMCIESPLEKPGLFSSLSGFTSTHPPIEKRISALMEMDGRM